jgi:rhodanese-related sulfurtransferase
MSFRRSFPVFKSMVFALGLFLPVAALACDGAAHAQRQLSIEQVTQLKKTQKVTLVDANNPETRSKYGVVPGAVLLTSGSKYEPGRELPTDKATQLVFYCANVKCQSAPHAAKRASEAGYQNVAVMPEGIMGWVKAGQPVERPATGGAQAASKS